jgi:hypothetical protein
MNREVFEGDNKQQLRPHLCQRQRHLCGPFPDEAVGRRRNQDDIAQADVGRDSPPSQPGHRRCLSRRPFIVVIALFAIIEFVQDPRLRSSA